MILIMALKNLPQNQISDFNADEGNDDPLQFAAFPVQIQFAKHRKIIFNYFKSIFHFFKAALNLESSRQAVVNTVEIFVVPGKVWTVENEQVLDDTVFAVEHPANELDHIGSADMDGAFVFHLVGKNVDFRQQFFHTAGVKIHRHGMCHVQHHNFRHIFRNLRTAEAAKAKMKRLVRA
jgi:hypothetical protein